MLDGENIEITTLKIEVPEPLEGEAAWQEDALRRDLTMNAMSIGLDGKLYDYYQGREDLACQR